MSVAPNRILLVHPEDPLPSTTCGRWDLILDLGYAPASAYANWSRERGCPVVSLSHFRDTENDLLRLRELMQSGMGKVRDDSGLDWWDLISLRFYGQILDVLALRRLFSAEKPSEIAVSRSGFHARISQILSDGNVRILRAQNSFRGGIASKTSHLFRLRLRQVLEILGDKYDGDYRIRHHFARRGLASEKPVVLLPSAYGNASGTALAYASVLPDERFLLVATRRGGWVENSLPNVATASLAAFAPGKCDRRELQRLASSWHELLRTFAQQRELSVLVRAGCFDSVPTILQEGLSVRDAWLEAFASNQISAVLCADEMNWYTRIPLLIARSRGIPTIACHHGALDFRYAFRETSADRLLVKGRMEWEYVVARGARAHEIEIGAPPRPTRPSPSSHRQKDAIVFFSEPYEVFGGRTQAFYRDVLPPLAQLAHQHGKALILKLHPYESRRERRSLAEAVLPPVYRKLLEFAEGPSDEHLFNRAWFGVTVNSTAAVDCAFSDVPAFICRWLDATPSGYSDQFINFGVAKKLSSTDEIINIPKMLSSFDPPDLADLLKPVQAPRLRELLSRLPSCEVDGEIAARVSA